MEPLKIEIAMFVYSSQEMMQAVRILAYTENGDPDDVRHLFFWPDTAIGDVESNIDDMCQDWPERRAHLERLHFLAIEARDNNYGLLVLEDIGMYREPPPQCYTFHPNQFPHLQKVSIVETGGQFFAEFYRNELGVFTLTQYPLSRERCVKLSHRLLDMGVYPRKATLYLGVEARTFDVKHWLRLDT